MQGQSTSAGANLLSQNGSGTMHEVRIDMYIYITCSMYIHGLSKQVPRSRYLAAGTLQQGPRRHLAYSSSSPIVVFCGLRACRCYWVWAATSSSLGQVGVGEAGWGWSVGGLGKCRLLFGFAVACCRPSSRTSLSPGTSKQVPRRSLIVAHHRTLWPQGV